MVSVVIQGRISCVAVTKTGPAPLAVIPQKTYHSKYVKKITEKKN